MISMLPNWMPLAFQGGDGQSALLSFVPMLVIMGIFYIVLFLPMRKRQKALAQMIEHLNRGERVITNGGIYGEVAGVVMRFASKARGRSGPSKDVQPVGG